MVDILIISYSPIERDPRVMRQVRLLENDYRLTVVGYGPKPAANIEYVELRQPRAGLPTKLFWGTKLVAGLSESYYFARPEVQETIARLSGRRFALTIANELSALPVASRLADGQPILFDAHEYSPREMEDQFMWRLLFSRHNHLLCKKYIPAAASMITVCDGIADEYGRHYGTRPAVVFNAPSDQHLAPSAPLRGRVRMIHHGQTIRARHLETMIDVMALLDARFTLDFMLVETDPAYMKELRERANGDPRIRFVAPVRMTEICQKLNDYDLGLYLLKPVNFNHEHALPNKFFEFMQARLAVAIGPSPEMARLLKQYGFGVIADSFEPSALATVLSSITDADLTRYKQAADAAARQLNFDTGSRVLLDEVRRLTAEA